MRSNADDATLVENADGDSEFLSSAKPLYVLPADNLVDEVLIPAFKAAERADCMIGFFSSSSLSDLAPGLATYINTSRNSFRLIVSPFLQDQDRVAIEKGINPDAVATEAMNQLLVSEDELQKHTLLCLSYLIRMERLQMKVALLKDGLFHPKVWLFEKGTHEAAVHGSSNMTGRGMRRNVEQITVSRKWEDPNQRYVVEKLRGEFESFWNNRAAECQVIGVPDAIKHKILRDYPANHAPSEDSFRELYKKATSVSVDLDALLAANTRPSFHVPDDLEYRQGPFAHQGRAVEAWCVAGYKGILEMATGAGKTITAMICANRLYEQHQPLLIVVAAPYKPLLQQWHEEMQLFGLQPINLSDVGGPSERTKQISRVARNLRLGISTVESLVVSHDLLCDPDFIRLIEAAGCASMLIADEVHNLGSVSFISNPPNIFEYRLGLSATPVRQYDQAGTDALFAYFGNPVFEYSLDEAIGHCLVEYDYYVHPVELTPLELEQWQQLTMEIRRNAWRMQDGAPDTLLNKLFRDRRALLETAQNKLIALDGLLDQQDLNRLRHTLIYATDKAPEQLKSVNRLLRNKGVLYHQLTASETYDRQKTQSIIKSFQDGDIQVLTAKRVLDEGVNIPQISLAYILASTTVERQWVQRRGRLLRTCSAIGKTHSVIHDFVVMPPNDGTATDDDAKRIARSELKRIQEFARLARNAGHEDGPLRVISELANTAYF